MEIEYENQVLTTVCQYLVAIVVPDFNYRSILQILHATEQMNHFLVEVTQLVVAEFLVVYQVPLTTSMLV